MITKNGTNKLERQINKAKKYVNVEIRNYSNKYFKVEKGLNENTFIVSAECCYLSNDFEWVIIKPINWNLDKPIFVKRFATLNAKNWFNNEIIFTLNPKYTKPEVLKELQKCIKGYDDIYKLNEFLKTREVYIEKKPKEVYDLLKKLSMV